MFDLRSRFFTNALTQPDQLRQRVAWALSQFFVISAMKDPDMEAAYVQARYHNMLFDEAFGNFENLLLRVTFSPQMGHYLDMVDNAKADPKAGTEPNENFARELLQLFSIGVVKLNTDGTTVLDTAGAPVPTYGQPEIKNFARVFTGWTYPPFDAVQPSGPDDRRYFAKPMVPVAADHDTKAKVLLDGATVPAGRPPRTTSGSPCTTCSCIRTSGRSSRSISCGNWSPAIRRRHTSGASPRHSTTTARACAAT